MPALTWQNTPYTALLVFAAVFLFTLAGYAWLRRKAQGAMALAALLAAAGLWTLSYALELSSATLAGKLLWTRLEYVGIWLIPLAWLVLALRVANRPPLSRRAVALLSIPSVLAVSIALTNDLHHLMWRQVLLVDAGSYLNAEFMYGPAFWVFWPFAHILTLSGVIILVQTVWRSQGLRRRQAMIVLAASAFPWAGNLLYITGLSPLRDLDLTPLGFCLTAVLAMWALFGFDLLNLRPAAQEHVIATMAAGLVVIDEQGNIIQTNPAAEQLIGLSEQTALGVPAQAILPPDLCAFLGSGEETTVLATPEEGRYLEIQRSALTNAGGAVVGQVLLLNDVSRREGDARALRRSEQRFRQSVQHSPNAIFAVDDGGAITSTNAACAQLMQVETEQLIGRHYSELLAQEEDSICVDELIERVFAGESSASVPLTFRRPSGDLRYTASRLYPLYDENGRVSDCIFANTDISEQRHSEQASRRYAQRLHTLHLIDRAILNAQTPQAIGDAVLAHIENLVPYYRGLILAFDWEREQASRLAVHSQFRDPAMALDEQIPLSDFSADGLADFKAGKPVIVNDLSQVKVRSPILQQLARHDVQSFIATPALVRNELVGLFTLEFDRPYAVGYETIEIASEIASSIGIALHQSRLQVQLQEEAATQEQRVLQRTAELKRTNTLIEALAKVSTRLQTNLAPQQVMNSLGQELRSLGMHCAILLLDAEKRRARAAYVSLDGDRRQQARTNLLGRPDSLTLLLHALPSWQALIGQGRPFYFDDPSTLASDMLPEAASSQAHSLLTEAGIDAASKGMLLPMRVEPHTLGVLAVWGESIQENDQMAMTLFADQVAAALEMSRLHEQLAAHRLAEQTALLRLSQALLKASTFAEIYDSSLDVLAEVLQPDICEVLMPHEKGGLLLSAARGWSDGLVGRLHIKKSNLESQAMFTLSQKTTITVNDFSQETRFDWPSLFRSHGVRASISAPLMVHDRVLGVLTALWRQPREGDEIAVQLMTLIANSMAQALARAQLVAETEQRAQQLEALYETSLAITSQLSLSALLPAIVQRAVELVGAPMGGLYLADLEKEELTLVVAYHLPGDPVGATLAFGEGLSGRVAESGEPVIIDDYRTWSDRAEFFSRYPLGRVLGVPLKVHGQIVGVLNIANEETSGTFKEDDLRLVQLFADQAAIAIENVRLLENEQEEWRLAEALRETGSALSATLEVEAVFDRLLEQVAHILPMDGGCIFTVERGFAHTARALGYRQYGEEIGETANALHLEIAATANLSRMVETREPLAIANTHNDPSWVPVFEQSPFHSWLGAPIFIEDEIVAFFSVEKIEPDFYSKKHIQRLKTFIGQAAIAIANARLYEQARERARLADRLEPISEALNRSSSYDRVISVIGESALTLTEADRIALYIRHEKDTIACPWRHNISQQYVQSMIDQIARVPGGKLLSSTEPVLLPDVLQLTADSPVRRHSLTEGHRALALWPLIYQDIVIAAVGCYYIRPHTWTQWERESMQTFTRQAAIALENARLFDAERQQLLLSQTLQAVGALLTTELGLSEVLEQILTLLGNVVEYDSASIHLVDEEGTGHLYAGRGFEDIERLKELMEAHSEGVFDRFQDRQVHIIPDTTRDPSWIHYPETPDIRSWIGAPLQIKGRLIGVLNVDCHRTNAFTSEIAQTVMAFANQAAIAIENARLFDQIHQRARHSEALNATIAAAATALNLQSLLDSTLHRLVGAVGAPKGMIHLGDRFAVAGVNQAQAYSLAGVLAAYPPGTAAGEGQIYDLRAPAALRQQLHAWGLQTFLRVPIFQQDEHIGDIGLGYEIPRAWSDEEKALIEATGRQMSAVAERLRLLEQTQQQARMMEQLVATVPDGVLLLDDAMHLALANPAATQALELLAQRDAEGRLTHLGDTPLDMLLAPESRPDRTMQAGSRIFELAIRALMPATQPGGWVMVLRDVTEQRRQQEQERQRQRLVAVGQLAAGIAHDFNNILQGIIGFADLLQKQSDMPPGAQRHLQLLAEQGRRGATLVRQILDFSRQSVIDKQYYDLAWLVRETLLFLQASFPDHIDITLSALDEAYPIFADAGQIQRLLTNLAFNARDAMPEGGDLSFRLTRVDLSKGETPPVAAMSPGEWVRLEIEDSGKGIAPGDMPFIFEPFYTTKGSQGGTGLGLSQVYGIVRQHDGFIDVKSDDSGATMIVYLPVALETGDHGARRPVAESETSSTP